LLIFYKKEGLLFQQKNKQKDVIRLRATLVGLLPEQHRGGCCATES
jgi:hypothetical protein